jgi:uncharacterized protein YbjQ (UPF0145 family)
VSNDNDNDDKKDITRIEQMPQFEHDENTQLPELPNLDDDEITEDDTLTLPDLPAEVEADPEMDVAPEIPLDLPSADFNSTDENFNGDITFDSSSNDFNMPEENTPPQENIAQTLPENTNENDFPSSPAIEETKVNEFEANQKKQDYSDSSFNEEPVKDPVALEAKESFAEVKGFAENLTYGNVTKGGNPPFSIMLKKIKFKEDKQDIENILREHGLLTTDNEKLYLQSLENGSLLLSQISEYSAIYLTHKFRRFDLEITMGLSDEIHPSKSYDHDFRGLVNKEHIFQNRAQSLEINSNLQAHQIILSTQATLPQFQILKYLGLISEHQIVDEEVIITSNDVDNNLNQGALEEIFRDLSSVKKDIKNVLPKNKPLELSQLYQTIAERLRLQAIKQGANAVVGIIYQLTALPLKAGDDNQKFKITCTGNAVIVSQSNQKNHAPSLS